MIWSKILFRKTLKCYLIKQWEFIYHLWRQQFQRLKLILDFKQNMPIFIFTWLSFSRKWKSPIIVFDVRWGNCCNPVKWGSETVRRNTQEDSCILISASYSSVISMSRHITVTWNCELRYLEKSGIKTWTFVKYLLKNNFKLSDTKAFIYFF